MPRRLSAKQIAKAHERFKTALTAFIISKGARTSRLYDYEIDTPAGLLLVSVYGNWIATRFENLELGKRFTATGNSCNPYSAKWNHHYSVSLDPDEVIADFGFQLDRLLNWQPAAV